MLVWKREAALHVVPTTASPSSQWDSKIAWRCLWIISVTVAAVRWLKSTAASVAPQVLPYVTSKNVQFHLGPFYDELACFVPALVF